MLIIQGEGWADPGIVISLRLVPVGSIVTMALNALVHLAKQWRAYLISVDTMERHQSKAYKSHHAVSEYCLGLINKHKCSQQRIKCW